MVLPLGRAAAKGDGVKAEMVSGSAGHPSKNDDRADAPGVIGSESEPLPGGLIPSRTLGDSPDGFDSVVFDPVV